MSESKAGHQWEQHLFKPWCVSTDDSASCLTGKTDIDANFQACNPVIE